MTDAPQDHYSYTLYARPDVARSFDDRRFGGPIGELVASRQAEVLLSFVGPIGGRRVLDVGTGTGRAALLLASRDAIVTGVDTSEQMLEVARQRAAAEGRQVTFAKGDAHTLQFPDRVFDTAVSLRVIMHTPEWRRCLAELCRVADRLVVVDYPAMASVAVFQSVGRRVLHALGVATEPYRVFSHRAIARELTSAGFRIRAVDRLFVLPIAVHKALGSRAVTERLERALARIGLLRIFGSPVTIVAERCASS